MTYAPTGMAAEADGDAFRRVWRGLGSTVCLLATRHDGTRHAMLATAVTSVSMDPPLLLICVNRSARTHAAIAAHGAFTLGILGSGCHGLARHFARAPGPERFAQGDWRALISAQTDLHHLPWLGQAQATLACRVETQHSHGTHGVFIARVVDMTPPAAPDPLLHCDGAFGRFTALGS